MHAMDAAHTVFTPSYDASDEKQVEKAKLTSKKRDHERAVALRALLSTRPGREWIWEVLSAAHIFSTSFVRGDAGASAFQEGERNMGLRLLADLQRHAPDEFLEMQREAAK